MFVSIDPSRLIRSATNDMCLCGIEFEKVCLFACLPRTCIFVVALHRPAWGGRLFEQYS